MRIAALIITFALAAPFAHAQDKTDIQFVDVTSQEFKVTAILYSSRAGSALVGITKNNGVRTLGTFAECKAPTGPLSSEIALKELGDCFVRTGSWFEVTPENQAKFDASFKYNLQSYYESLYHNEVLGGNSVTMIMYPVFGMALTGGTIYAGLEAWKLFKSGKKIAGMVGLFGAGFLGVVTGFWDYASVSHFIYVNFSKAPSIESIIVADYNRLLMEKPETPKIDFSKVHWALNYDIMKRAIFTSITSVGYPY